MRVNYGSYRIYFTRDTVTYGYTATTVTPFYYNRLLTAEPDHSDDMVAANDHKYRT